MTYTLPVTGSGSSQAVATDDHNAAINAAIADAVNGLAPLANPTFTGTVSGINKAMVGLGSVDNTADADKPVSTAQAAALAAKAPLADPIFTGTVSGISKAMVGLGNVDNTADAAKPVSAAQAEADRETGLTSGDVLGVTSSLFEMLNGAVEIVVAGRRVGMTIPGAATASGAYVIPRIPIHQEDAARLAGQTVRIRTVMTASENFMAVKGFGGNAVRVEMQDGTILTNAGAVLSVTQSGTTIIRDMTYVMTGTETRIGATMQIGGSATAVGSDHSFQITSVAFDVIASGADAQTSGDAMADLRLGDAMIPVAYGFDLLRGLPQTFNGAVKRFDAAGREMGVTVPAGQSGQNTILQAALDLGAWERAELTGRTVRITMGFTTSADWDRSGAPNMQLRLLNGSLVSATTSAVRDVQIASTRRLIEFSFVMPANAADLRPWVQLTSASAAGSEEFIELTDFALSLPRSQGDAVRRGAETLAWGAELVRRAAAGDGAASGRGIGWVLEAGDFADLSEAVDAAAGLGAPGRLAAVRVPAGVTAEGAVGLGTAPDHVALIGAGMGRTIIDGSQPDSADIPDIIANSVLEFDGETLLQGLTVQGANVRYAWHLDAVKAKPDRVTRAVDCEFIHLGNDGAELFHGGVTTETTGSRVTWASMHAIGSGLSSGQRVELTGCVIRGPRAGAQFHNQTAFDKPCEVVIEDCDLSAEWVAYWGLLLQSNGSGTPDRVTLRTSTISGRIRLDAVPWLRADSYQPANHMEFQLSGSGNSPCAVDVVDFGRALRIDSATTGLASSVVVSGTAAPLLFGDVTTVPGDVGRAGAAYGYLDIQDTTGVGPASDQFITGLGKRLGNRVSLGSVTLTVTIDGGTPINVVLAGDYTASTNATILGIINTALGAAGVASEFNVGGTYRPMFTDQERRLKNTGSATILQGMALARGASDRQVRIMTSADALDLFAGIALEDIRPGAYGRVMHRGWIALGWALRKPGEGSTINLGDSFNIDAATPGHITRIAGGAGILRCVTPSLGAALVTLEVGP